ncbi:MAG: biotin/lipoyl-containing protein, partial [Acidimicrobiales bacterium]
MPQLGETVTEGTITRWAKKVGDHVDEDEVLFEVSTDKVDSEVPSPVAGVVAEILVQEGETADVGARLAVISDGEGGSGGGQAETSAGAASGNGAAPPAEAATEEKPEAGAEPGPEPAPAEGPAPAPDRAAEVEAAEPENAGAEAPADQSPASNGDSPAPAPAESAGGKEKAGDGQARVLSPVVRRLLKEHNLDPSEVTATGAGGRITRADVLAVVDSRSAGGPARSAPA